MSRNYILTHFYYERQIKSWAKEIQQALTEESRLEEVYQNRRECEKDVRIETKMTNGMKWYSCRCTF